MFGRFLIKIAVLLVALPAFADWSPIQGIPEPSFGVNEVAPPVPDSWNSQVAGFYYVDPTHPNATDSNNSNGYPDRPRVRVPSSIPAGAVVEVHGTISRRVTVNSSGTADKPIFIRGESYEKRPTFQYYLYLEGSYIIVENIKTQPTSSQGNGSSGLKIKEGAHHIAVRDAEISGSGNNYKTGGIGIGSWGYSGSETVDNVLLNRLDIHDIGDMTVNFDQDGHGVTVSGNSQNIWIVNSSMQRFSGDGVQIEAQHKRGADSIHHVFIGNNTISNNKQTALWVKHARDVVFSSNHMYGMRRSDSSNGPCAGYQYSALNVWFIHNRVHDCEQGIVGVSGDSGEQGSVYHVNNTIYDIHSSMPNNPHQSGGIMLRMSNVDQYVIGNTIVGSDVAISAPIRSGNLKVIGNVLVDNGKEFGSDVYFERIVDNMVFDNNIVYRNPNIRLNWNGTIYNSLAALYNGKSQCGNCTEEAPTFVNPGAENFSLAAGSIAPDMNHPVIQEVYNRYYELYGVPLAGEGEVPAPMPAPATSSPPEAPSNISIQFLGN
ncbi:MAG: hypothetical protein CSA49_05780 [Gammaproteobacteria bacterium]|nr:MAG: hypothetical protein CSA49_05780 [Gammaproteobacteria bacterium]